MGWEKWIQCRGYYNNIINISVENLDSLREKLLRLSFKGRDVVDKVMEESIPLSRDCGPAFDSPPASDPFTFFALLPVWVYEIWFAKICMHQIHFTVSSLKEGYISRLFPLLLVLLRPAFDSSSVVSQEAGTAAQFIPRLLLRSSRRQMLLSFLVTTTHI